MTYQIKKRFRRKLNAHCQVKEANIKKAKYSMIPNHIIFWKQQNHEGNNIIGLIPKLI